MTYDSRSRSQENDHRCQIAPMNLKLVARISRLQSTGTPHSQKPPEGSSQHHFGGICQLILLLPRNPAYQPPLLMSKHASIVRKQIGLLQTERCLGLEIYLL